MTKCQINPQKLLMSKWTAVHPKNKEKHFIVTHLIKNDEEVIIACVLEAVINHREIEMAWQDLKDTAVWQSGWL